MPVLNSSILHYYCDNDNDNNINKNKARHRHFSKDSCYKSKGSKTPKHYHILEQHVLVYIIPFT